MNEQGTKKIIFKKSTLFSLKAELLRKQEEVNEKKQLPKHKLENFKPPSSVRAKGHEKNPNQEYKKSFKDSLKAIDTEELEACRKAKAALEKKAELYEHLSDSAGSSQLAGRFLVDFDSKKKQEVPKQYEEEEKEQPIEEDAVKNQPDENEWTEFTDCLGRTRKCHKSDLEMFRERDKQLMRVMGRGTSSSNEDTAADEPSPPPKEQPLLVKTTYDYLQSLREKWEKKEQELLAKDKDIHYQDLLFDEARIHGVGYYNFSTDEDERRKQMNDLLKEHEETLKAQQEAEQIRKKRDEMIAARVAAARARQRARAGLPPEDPAESNQKDFNTCLLEFLTQQKNEADAKATEEERKIKEEKEKERQKIREAYVREWDIGKEGVSGNVKAFKEMSQEEYVELQRSKRIDEFAPTQTSTSAHSNAFDEHGRMLSVESIPKIRASQQKEQKTWAEVRPRAMTPPPPDIGDLNEFSQKGLYFSSNNKKNISLKYRNFVRAQEPTPIIDELAGYTAVIQNDQEESRTPAFNDSEIAPPPTYDYYGPVPKKAKFQKPFESDIREAFAQGAKSLETKSSNRKLPQHYDFTFD